MQDLREKLGDKEYWCRTACRERRRCTACAAAMLFNQLVEEQAAVCLIGHLRSLPLPAVHGSIGDNVLSVLSERFAVSLSATLFLNEDNSTTVEGVCNSRANAQHAMHALGAVIRARPGSRLGSMIVADNSSCATVAQYTGINASAGCETTEHIMHALGGGAKFLQIYWLSHCFGQSPKASLFVRIRPDSFFSAPLDVAALPAYHLAAPPTVVIWPPAGVSSAPGSDQFFLMNQGAYQRWWRRMERSIAISDSWRKKLGMFTEYRMFRDAQDSGVAVVRNASIFGCLARSLTCLQCHLPCPAPPLPCDSRLRNGTREASILLAYERQGRIHTPPRCMSRAWSRLEDEETAARAGRRFTASGNHKKLQDLTLSVNTGLRCWRPDAVEVPAEAVNS